jgi:transcriptional regulator with XRE-family HTH domain
VDVLVRKDFLGMAIVEVQERKVQRKTRGKPNAVDIHVGTRVRQRRTLLGLSQERLATALDLTFQQVQKYERGANRIGAGRLYELARALDVPVTYFFDDMDGANYPSTGSVNEDSSPAYQVDPMSQRETLLLVRAYYAIPDPAVRRRMLDLMRSMADGYTREDD